MTNLCKSVTHFIVECETEPHSQLVAVLLTLPLLRLIDCLVWSFTRKKVKNVEENDRSKEKIHVICSK